LHAAEGSLADVLSAPPAWWTPTARAKAVAGIALGLRFAHGLGLLHGGLKASNVLFDAERRIQIVDFSPTRLDKGAVEPFSGDGWSPAADVSAFAALLSEIAVGAAGGPAVPPGVPEFVSRTIEEGQSPGSQPRLSFVGIVARPKENRFQIMAGVDSEEVSAFVRGVELAEQSGKWEETQPHSTEKNQGDDGERQ
jgi:serine/threonine protein kinase